METGHVRSVGLEDLKVYMTYTKETNLVTTNRVRVEDMK